LWFETNDAPLPTEPQYVTNPYDLGGTVIPPHTAFLETFRSRTLNANDIKKINGGMLRLCFYGFVEYSDSAATVRKKGFIGRYEPANNPNTGMFRRMPEAKAYEYGD
jgi:hypothetical protein